MKWRLPNGKHFNTEVKDKNTLPHAGPTRLNKLYTPATAGLEHKGMYSRKATAPDLPVI